MHPNGTTGTRAAQRTAVLSSVELLLTKLAKTQQVFLQLLQEKAVELRRPRFAKMRDITTREHQLVQQLHGLEQRRKEILASAAPLGLRSATLRTLLKQLAADGHETDELLGQMSSCEQTAVEIRQLSWTQWIVAQRASAYFKSVLELVANHGQAPPDYCNGTQRPIVGGAILDASA